MDEAKMYGDNCCFLTLTFNEDHLPENGSISKRDLQLFMKKLRKAVGKVRFFACGEYGDKYARPHYHLALFGVPVDSPVFLDRVYNPKRRIWTCRMKEWPAGFAAVGHLTVDSANYIAGYMVKKVKGKGAKEYYKKLCKEPEFALMSRRPGIGSEFLKEHAERLHDLDFMVAKGVRYPLPRYYRDKLFTDEEKSLKSFNNLKEQVGVPVYESPEMIRLRREQFVLNFNARRELKEKPLND